MNRRFRLSALLTVALAALATGCTETQLPTPTGKAGVRGINAIAAYGEVAFNIEQRNIASVGFKESSSRAQYDDLSYTFNFEVPQTSTAPLRVGSRTVDVVADTDYTFVLAGDVNDQEVFLWESPTREWTESDTVFEAIVGHVNPDFGTVDVYLGADGTVPVAGNAIGTLAFGEQIGPIDVEAGEYQVTLTPENDPGTVLYRTAATTLPAAESLLFAVFQADPEITGPAALRVFTEGGAATSLADERFPPTVQFLNASLETGAIDVALDGDYASLAVSGLAFGAVSADVEVPTTGTNYQYAPAGTTAAVLEEDVSLAAGFRSLFVLVGDSGDLSTLRLPSVRRGISTISRLRLINAVTNTESIDIYIRAPGTDIETVLPNAFNIGLGFNSVIQQLAGEYEVTVTANGSSTPLAAPVPLSLSTNEVVELVVLDAVDPNAVDVLIFDNATP